jgi:NAD(P)-dependent dehydrogenase (short-subunit alcohol dehydrogenase family)
MVIAMRMRQYDPMFPRTALVTGGASGIGAAIVDLLRSEGAEVQALDVADGFDVSDSQAWEKVGAVELATVSSSASGSSRA